MREADKIRAIINRLDEHREEGQVGLPEIMEMLKQARWAAEEMLRDDPYDSNSAYTKLYDAIGSAIELSKHDVDQDDY